jgi:hypothetical protein
MATKRTVQTICLVAREVDGEIKARLTLHLYTLALVNALWAL